MEYIIRAMGVKRVSTKFTRMGEASLDMRPAFLTIVELLFAIEEQIFNSQGRRGGGSWARDTPEWLNEKMRLNLDPRINHASGALRASVTQQGARGQVIEMTPHNLFFGSDLPQAKPSQKNRPFIKYSANDRLRMRGLMRNYLMEAWRSA